jgi:hypothetical protein
MAGKRFGMRMTAGGRDAWVLLLSVFGGATAWGFGMSVPQSVGAAGAMLGAALVVSAVRGPRDETPALPRPGSRQRELICLLDGHVRSLRGLRNKPLPDVVQAKADDALAAADAARPSVLQVAASVDALDEAIAAAGKVEGRGDFATESISKAVGRLRARRAMLLDRLAAAVDEVATVYTGLLELGVTARTIDVLQEGIEDGTELSTVNDAVTLLRMTFAELESDAASLSREQTQMFPK